MCTVSSRYQCIIQISNLPKTFRICKRVFKSIKIDFFIRMMSASCASINMQQIVDICILARKLIKKAATTACQILPEHLHLVEFGWWRRVWWWRWRAKPQRIHLFLGSHMCPQRKITSTLLYPAFFGKTFGHWLPISYVRILSSTYEIYILPTCISKSAKVFDTLLCSHTGYLKASFVALPICKF